MLFNTFIMPAISSLLSALSLSGRFSVKIATAPRSSRKRMEDDCCSLMPMLPRVASGFGNFRCPIFSPQPISTAAPLRKKQQTRETRGRSKQIKEFL